MAFVHRLLLNWQLSFALAIAIVATLTAWLAVLVVFIFKFWRNRSGEKSSQPEDVGVKISRPLTSRFPRQNDVETVGKTKCRSVATQTEILPVMPRFLPWTDANPTRPDLQSPHSDEESEPSGSPTAASPPPTAANSQEAKDNSQLKTSANEELLSDVKIWQKRKKPKEKEIVVERPTAPQLSQLKDVVIVKKICGLKFTQK